MRIKVSFETIDGIPNIVIAVADHPDALDGAIKLSPDGTFESDMILGTISSLERIIKRETV